MAELAKSRYEEEVDESQESDASPPPYSGRVHPLLESAPPPDYHESQLPPPPLGLQAPFAPYRPFPPIMNTYYVPGFSVAALKTYKLCGDDENETLFSIECHTGFIPHGPLRARPGFILHNGPTHKHPILAAVGSESSAFEKIREFGLDLRSTVLLPPILHQPYATDLVTELLRVSLVDKDGPVSFRISLVRGPDTDTREEFEWRRNQVADIETPGDAPSGYKLLRLSAYQSGWHETVAFLTWPGLSRISEKVLTLELKGSALTGALGDRYVLMIIMTAQWIWNSCMGGNTQLWPALHPTSAAPVSPRPSDESPFSLGFFPLTGA